MGNIASFWRQKVYLDETNSTLRATAGLLEDLLNEDYSFVLTARFQSDPIERHFSKYRQMSGGRFLVALREVQSSEKILQMKSLAKAGFNFWKMDLQPSDVNFNVSSIVESVSNEIQDCELDEKSNEISVYVAGFITKKLLKNKKTLSCESCITLLKENLVEVGTEYLHTLNRGGLNVPSKLLSSHVTKSFAVLDVNELLRQQILDKIRSGSEQVLRLHIHEEDLFLCNDHSEWGLILVNRTIVNVFFNNQQHIDCGNIKKDDIATNKTNFEKL